MGSKYFLTIGALFVFLFFGCKETSEKQAQEVKKPNILFCISDDQSWLHTSFAGARELATPAFDDVAKKGIYFSNAYCAASSCAPSRAAILTGQEIWRLDEGGLLFGALPKKHPVFTKILKRNGYATAWTGKGYAPAKLEGAKYYNQPIGKGFHEFKGDYPESLMACDYAANFEQFMDQRDTEQPFFFWYGGHEPHRIYEEGIGEKSGKNLNNIEVPSFLPDNDVVKGDIADYYYEIEWFDSHLARMVKTLEAKGELENTIIVVTADNGMPFPRAKTTSYEYGTHMPLAICWGNKIKGARKIEDFISFTDFGPTFLEAAGIAIPKEMTGKSFLKVLKSGKEGTVDPERNTVYTALERHTYCRPDGMPYPIRTIHKGDYLYIHNFEPDRWPAGNADFVSPHQGIYGDIDTGTTREYMIANSENDAVKPIFDTSFGKRPQEELYNIADDFENLNNLADHQDFQKLKSEMKAELFSYLKATNDPRVNGESPWGTMPYYFEGFDD